jgi:hypothetical protein
MEFNFDELIAPEMLAKVRARKAEVRTSLYKKLAEKGEVVPDSFKAYDKDVKYSATRANLDSGTINSRYFTNKADLLNHLINIGYMADYATKQLLSFEDMDIQLPTDSEKIVYVVKKHVKDSDKFSMVVLPGKKIWLIDLSKLMAVNGIDSYSDSFVYYIDEDKKIYRENANENTVLKMGLTDYNARILSVNISVNRIWNEFRLNEIKRGE